MTTTEANGYIITSRQRRVLLCLADGKSTNEMCAELQLSDRTIKDAIKEMMVLFEAKNRTGVVGRALREGVIK